MKRRHKLYSDFTDYYYPDYEDDVDFADPGGRSALRAASKSNPRNLPCPDCGRKNVLTPKDREQGYCCDRCADRNWGRCMSQYGEEY